jgi:hypothetical protein
MRLFWLKFQWKSMGEMKISEMKITDAPSLKLTEAEKYECTVNAPSD